MLILRTRFISFYSSIPAARCRCFVSFESPSFHFLVFASSTEPTDVRSWLETMRRLHNGKIDLSEAENLFLRESKFVPLPCTRCSRVMKRSRLTWSTKIVSCNECDRIHPDEVMIIFLEQAKARFGDLYDYRSISLMKSLQERVSIRCRSCDQSFVAVAEMHLAGTGSCPHCHQLHWADRAREKFGDRYEYSELSKGRLHITCKQCGHQFEVATGGGDTIPPEHAAAPTLSKPYTLTSLENALAQL